MSMELDNKVAIAILQEQMKTVLLAQEQLINNQTEILKEIQVFTTAITTGKWIFGSLLVIIGALGHKGIVWATDFISR